MFIFYVSLSMPSLCSLQVFCFLGIPEAQAWYKHGTSMAQAWHKQHPVTSFFCDRWADFCQAHIAGAMLYNGRRCFSQCRSGFASRKLHKSSVLAAQRSSGRLLVVSLAVKSVKSSNDLGSPMPLQPCTVWKSELKIIEICLSGFTNHRALKSAHWILEDVVWCPGVSGLVINEKAWANHQNLLQQPGSPAGLSGTCQCFDVCFRRASP